MNSMWTYDVCFNPEAIELLLVALPRLSRIISHKQNVLPYGGQ